FQLAPSVTPLAASSADLGGGHVAPALTIGTTTIASPLFRLFPFLSSFYGAAPFALLFVLGLLQAQWTYTGFDASAHVAEETVMARLNSAWGVFLSVAVSAVVGYVLLLVLTWSIPEGALAATAADTYPVLFIVDHQLSPLLANLIALVIGGAMWLCGCSSITSMARMGYAFARDGGVPGWRLLRRVSPRFGTPVWSIVLLSTLSVVLCLYAAAFSVITSISTIALYLAYGIPVFLNLRNKVRRKGEFTTKETAPFSLGRWGKSLNVVAVVWIVFITIIFSLPPNELVFWTMSAAGIVLAIAWFAFARKWFAGPGGDPEALSAARSGRTR
ncbi:MAG: amino acid permease, partial [Thermoanaerobaculia bacterium]